MLITWTGWWVIVVFYWREEFILYEVVILNIDIKNDAKYRYENDAKYRY